MDGGVAQDVALVGKVASDAANAELFDGCAVSGLDRCGALGGIAVEQYLRDRCSIDQGVVEDRLAGVFVDALDMLRCSEIEAFVGLRSSDCRDRCGRPSMPR